MGGISFLGGLGGVARYWGVLPAMCFCCPASFCGFGEAGGISWGGGLSAMDSGAVMFRGHCRPTCSPWWGGLLFFCGRWVLSWGGIFFFSSRYINVCGFRG